jgi:hypothetical protein
MRGEFQKGPFQNLRRGHSRWDFFALSFQSTAASSLEITSKTQGGILTHRLDDSIQGG